VADVNNDGLQEYVLCDRNSVGLHNDRVVAVYIVWNAVLVETKVPEQVPFLNANMVYHFAEPFLSKTKDGMVVISLRERYGNKAERITYAWTEDYVEEVERAPLLDLPDGNV
jgi:hypothetical protein